MSKHTDTTRSGDLVERLRDLAGKFEGQGGKHYTAELFGECADRIAALEADKARLMGLVKEAGEALAPFAECAEQIVSIEDADLADAIERGEV